MICFSPLAAMVVTAFVGQVDNGVDQEDR